jgi:hypothetical protein
MGPACRRRDQGQLPGVPPREGRKGGAVGCTTVPRAVEGVARDLDDLLKVFDGLLRGEYQPLEGALRVYGPVRDWNVSAGAQLLCRYLHESTARLAASLAAIPPERRRAVAEELGLVEAVARIREGILKLRERVQERG